MDKKILWKMPATRKTCLWAFNMVYDDFVWLHSQYDDAEVMVDLATGEGMIAQERRNHWKVSKFRVSDSLNDLLVDALEGVERLGVPA